MADEDDGQFDYRSLTRDQIEFALAHIDESSYPKNFANARAALAERCSGGSPEPPPILDEATDAKYTYWVEKFLSLLIGVYAAIGLAIDDLTLPSRRGLIHLHGYAAWVGALALLVLAAIPFFGGIGGSNSQILRPHFTWVFRIVLLLIAVAVWVSHLRHVT